MSFDPSQAAVVRFPLVGEWVAVATPAERVPSHGTDYFGQRYAYDFVQGDVKAGRLAEVPTWRYVLGSVPAQRFFAWNQPVLAAFDGRVVGAGDGWPDQLRVNAIRAGLRALFHKPPPHDDHRPLTGNYLLVEGAPGVALYAHLRNGSVRVQLGDDVRAGDLLGHVGNSGNSTMPHLHFHLMSQADPHTAEGRPCAFAALEQHDGTQWRPCAGGVPEVMRPVRVSARAEGA